MSDPAGLGVTLLYVTIVMLALSWITVILRLSVRRWLKPDAMGLDDSLMCIGLSLYSVTCSLVITCSFYGSGQESKYLDPADIMQGTKLFFVAEFFYAACTVPIKSSICVTLIRVADARRRFTWTLFGLIGASIVATVVFILGIANICHPVEAFWGAAPGVCSSSLNSSVSFFFSAISIVTDTTLAILPGLLLYPIQMKRRLKISVAILLGMGAFASCATVVRLRYLTLYNDMSEFMYGSGHIGLWSVVEEGIGIVAGSMPALRPLLSLPFFGGSTQRDSEGNESTPAAFHASDISRLPGETADGVEMGAVRLPEKITVTEGGSDDGDGDSQTQILVRTQVTISSENTTAGGKPRQRYYASDRETWSKDQQDRLGLESQVRNDIRGGK